MTKFTDEVVRICNEELDIFQNGKLREYDKAVFKRVGLYWDTLAQDAEWKAWKGYNGRSDSTFKLDSKGEVDRVLTNKNQPWSAAFISYVARTAGAKSNFSYAPAHSKYIVEALNEAKKKKSTAKFIARRHKQYSPKAGDLIACERLPDSSPDFDTYIDFVKAGRYEAHCDFVVGKDQAGRILTVGGNVGNSVKLKKWPLSTKGFLPNDDPTNADASVICVIECLL